jgi:predicted Na+-dependent transporter
VLVPYVPLLFAYLTFVMASNCSFRQIREALKMPVPMLLTFVLAHVIMPFIAYEVGKAVYGGQSPYVVGFVMFTAIPLGVSSIIWIGLSKGNVPLALSMVLLDSAVSSFVVPWEMKFFFGTHIEFDHVSMMLDLVKIIVVPTIIGIIFNFLSGGRFHPWSQPVTGPTSKLAMIAVIMANVSAIQPYVAQMKEDLINVVPLSALLVVLCYVSGFLGSLMLKQPPLVVTVTYSCGMRNISLGLVIALAYFEPLAAVPVVMSILIQQPFATINRWFMNRYWNSAFNKKLTGSAASRHVR